MNRNEWKNIIGNFRIHHRMNSCLGCLKSIPAHRPSKAHHPWEYFLSNTINADTIEDTTHEVSRTCCAIGSPRASQTSTDRASCGCHHEIIITPSIGCHDISRYPPLSLSPSGSSFFSLSKQNITSTEYRIVYNTFLIILSNNENNIKMKHDRMFAAIECNNGLAESYDGIEKYNPIISIIFS